MLDVFHRPCLRTILGDSKTLLQQGSGKWLATSSDCNRERPVHNGCQKTTKERGIGRRIYDEVGLHSKKNAKSCVTAGMESAGSPVTNKLQMQTSRRPMIREEQADLNLSETCIIRLVGSSRKSTFYRALSTPKPCSDLLNIVFVLRPPLWFVWFSITRSIRHNVSLRNIKIVEGLERS